MMNILKPSIASRCLFSKAHGSARVTLCRALGGVREEQPQKGGEVSPPDGPLKTAGTKAEGPILVYKAMFGAKLKLLRRISLTSSISSVVGLPIVISLSGGDLSMAAKLAIGGTAVFASLASTAILQAITFPYVTNLWLLPGSSKAGSGDTPADPRFRATTLNLLGNPVTKQFSLSEMDKIKVTSHPYANFRAGHDYYYVRTAGIEPKALRDEFAARCNAPSKVMKET